MVLLMVLPTVLRLIRAPIAALRRPRLPRAVALGLISMAVLHGIAAEAADLRIAVVAPLSGPYQALGQEIKAGAGRAVADINAAGGIKGQMLKLDLLDDGCRPDLARQVAAKAVRDAIVIGHVCAGAATAAASVYAGKGVLAISPAVTDDDFTDNRPGPTIFRLAARDDAQGDAVAAFLAANARTKRIAILSDDSPYGKQLADAVKKGLDARGVKIARSDSFEPGAKDYTGLADVMIGDGIGALFVAGYDGDVALIASALSARKAPITLMGGDALATSEYGAEAGAAAQGTLLTFFTDWRAHQAAAGIAAAFRADGVEPRGFVLPAYAAVQIAAAARVGAGSTKGADLAAWLAANSVDTVLGAVAFNAKGDATLSGFEVYRWQGDSFVPLSGS